MTVDEFIHAVRQQNALKFAQTVASLTEAERKVLSKTAQQLLSEAREGERQALGPPTDITFNGRQQFVNALTNRLHPGLMARLAVLAVCSKSTAVKSMPMTGDYETAAFQILIDRRPEWAADWLNLQLQRDFPNLKFENVRRLIREGGCPKPSSRGYAQTFASTALLLDYEANPDLFDDVWLLFQHDVMTFVYFPERKDIKLDDWKQSPGDNRVSWGGYPRLIYHHAHHGRLDRGRVLDETLAALWRDFNGSSRPGLMKLHELFEPDKDERSARQGVYRDLLQHSASAVVGFGLQMLKSIQKDGGLDTGEFVDAVPAVLSQKTKSHSVAALGMLKTVVKEHPDLASTAAAVVIKALSHEAVDVQESALGLLEAWSGKHDGFSYEALAEQKDFISAKLKSRLDSLIQKSSASGVTNGELAEPVEAAPTMEISPVELEQRASLLPAQLRVACGIDAALAALEHDELPPPVSIDQVPSVLADLQLVEPIRDLDELIECVSRAVEVLESPMEVERIIDGICRFRGERPNDFEERTAPLLKRLEENDNGFPVGQGFLTARGLVPTFVFLVLDWLYGDDMKPCVSGWVNMYYRRPQPAGSAAAQRLVNARLEALRQRLKKGEFGPLLSMPTHEHGWIDARAFVERLQADLAGGRVPSQNEVVYGLLRLAPDFRKQAIEASRALPDPYGRLVRFALGCDESVTSKDQEWADAWLAAGRTRIPRGPLPELQCLKYPAAANATASVEYQLNWNIDQQALQYQMYVNQPNKGVVRVEPAIPDGLPTEQSPTIALVQQVGHYAVFGSFPGWVEEWLATFWPANSDCFLAMGIDRLMVRMDASGSSWFQLGSAIRPLLAGERDWSPIALATQWVGLLSRDAEVRAVARDALAAAMQDSRAHPQPLSEALLELADKDWFKLNRLADSLRDVARVSRWAMLVTVEILDRLIASWKAIPRDGHHVLELHLDLLAELQVPLSEPARAVLGSQSGSGKAAKLARQLCQLQFEGRSTARRAALMEMAEARIARAERVEQAVR